MDATAECAPPTIHRSPQLTKHAPVHAEKSNQLSRQNNKKNGGRTDFAHAVVLSGLRRQHGLAYRT